MNKFIEELEKIIASKHIYTKPSQLEYYCKGFRLGKGEALAVIFPQDLLQLWKILKTCVDYNKIILMQASNTGLTGGSTPDGNNYDREVVIISTIYLKGIYVIDNGNEIIALPGSTLTELEEELDKYHKEPHSVIGSTCIGASVVGGICNNSGGSLVRRGPAYTQKSLFVKINTNHELELVNHLDIELGNNPEEIINNLQSGNFNEIKHSSYKNWADDYALKVKDIGANTPSRYNEDTSYLYESSGSAGKLIVFAVRIQTFEKVDNVKVFYVGTNSEKVLVNLRREILTRLTNLPIQAEYLDRSTFNLSKHYAKHVFLAVKYFGSKSMPKFLKFKNFLDNKVKFIKFLPVNLIDMIIHLIMKYIPKVIPKRLLDFNELYEHQLMISIEDNQLVELKTILTDFFKVSGNEGGFFLCNEKEADDAFLLRFVAGSSSGNYCDYHNIKNRIVSFDVAFRRNDEEWLFHLPKELQEQVLISLCYGHFMCYVSHQLYILKEEYDKALFQEEVKKYLDTRGAKYPAEHNVGHIYQSSNQHIEFFQKLDPTNTLNPGIGKTTKKANWQ